MHFRHGPSARRAVTPSKLRLKADTGETVVIERGGRVADLIEQWKEVIRLTRRPSTVAGYLGMINVYIMPAFGRDDPKAITRNRDRDTGTASWRSGCRCAPTACSAVLSSFLTWLEHDHRIDHNPCKSVRKRSESPRQVFLSAKEIAAAHKALKAHNNRSAALTLRLTLLTGCRIGEALKLAPDQIDSARKVWVKPAAYVKTARTHIIPLQAEALDVAKELL